MDCVLLGLSASGKLEIEKEQRLGTKVWRRLTERLAELRTAENVEERGDGAALPAPGLFD